MKRVRFSLQTLRIFAKVAELRSITSAAMECGLTQSAVTKHIAALEESLQVTLLERGHHGVRLTSKGADYLKSVRRALAILDDASEKLHQGASSGQLSMGVALAVGQRWLIPRLGAFTEEAGIRVRLVPRLPEPDAMVADNYAEIRFGTGTFPGWSATYLIGRDYAFVLGRRLHQDLLRGRKTGFRVTQALIEQVPLLFHVLGPSIWTEVLARRKLQLRAGHYERTDFEQYSVLIPAAVAGQGLGLVPRFLIEQEIQSGELVPIDEPEQARIAFYLLLPPRRRQTAALRKLAAWLLEQTR